MKTKWKIVIGIIVVLLIASGVFASVKYRQRGVVTVQTGKVMREDLASVVTASGEVKPRNYISIGAEYSGQLIDILVKEGDHVRKGQLLARIDGAQSQADVTAQRAALASAEADTGASEAGVKAGEDNITVLEAAVTRTKADLERYERDFARGQQLFKDGLIPRSDFEQRHAVLESQKASVTEAESRVLQSRAQLAQLRAQLSGTQKRIAQTQAALTRVDDILRKHNAVAPIDGLVTYLPVRVGETVVPGIQNSAASTIMTIADMSIVTAEVKVDETDIVNVKLGQPAEITVDAIPNKIFTGHVIEIGNTAILRSTGLAASTSTTSSQEAKDFKVVVAMDNPPDEIRPGLSSTAKITTATRKSIVAIPIQALTTRTKGDLIADKDKPLNPDPATVKANKEESQGVFVIGAENKSLFRKVETGITGATDIEVLSGLKEGDQIVTGSYQIIRSMKNGAVVKVDNKPPAAARPTT
ncbi:MAG TPA: efflux RND transporter periplasmic adaptor subunit [Bryobacteraceae bacterium]|nr:efflux RND transporter periplasmic adaptor subunit [Bryobacteraceae bacterium]